jgi:hypothetical protein
MLINEPLWPDVRHQIDEAGQRWVWVTFWNRDGFRIGSRAYRVRDWRAMDDEARGRALSGDRVCEPQAYNR